MTEATAPRSGEKGSERVGLTTFRWPTVPMPIMVAVVGLLLGSWLLPAFTRQWDDRQRAGELKAAIVADVASVTGRALMSAHEAATATSGGPQPAGSAPTAGTEWSISSLEIRATLQAYFGPGAADHWALVSQYVTSTLTVAYSGPEGAAVIPNPWLSVRKSARLEQLFAQYLAGEDVLESLVIEILAEAERFTSGLLTTHVRGYSTTLQDLVSDLLP